MALDPQAKRMIFASLAGVAVVTLVVALAAVLVPLPGIQWWLIGCLVVLVLVIAAEAVLLVMDRPKQDKENYEFVIGDDETTGAR